MWVFAGFEFLVSIIQPIYWEIQPVISLQFVVIKSLVTYIIEPNLYSDIFIVSSWEENQNLWSEGKDETRPCSKQIDEEVEMRFHFGSMFVSRAWMELHALFPW